MKFINLCSGSSKNSSLIYNEDTLILIDCGVGVTLLKKELKNINKTIDDIDYCFITHEHFDHIKNIKLIDPNKIYTFKKVLKSLKEDNYLKEFKEYFFKSFKIIPLKLSHDSNNIMGLYILDLKNNDSLGYITDTGYIPFESLKYLYNLNYYYIESNYDEEMEISSSRSYELISRNIGVKGHLSNSMSAIYINELINVNTSNIFLAHLSHECNSPILALSTYNELLKNNPYFKNIKIECCKQNEVTYL